MREYTVTEQMKCHYASLAKIYRDSLLRMTHLHPMVRVFVSAEDCIVQQNYDSALRILSNSYDTINPLHRNAGVIAYSIAVAYSKKGDLDKATEYYARSAIADICAGVKDHTSLRRLAELMYNGGDIDRAYNYMKNSLEDALYCNARLMTIETSDMFMMIDQAYQQKEKQRQSVLVWFLVVVSVLLVLLLVLFIIIRRQNLKLKKAQNDLALSNVALIETNQSLVDSNRIKEEYVGLYMEQYSNYLAKMSSVGNKVRKYTKGGDVDIKGLLEVIDRAVNTDAELKELYNNFDAAILHLFPDFVKQFDELLIPDARGMNSNTAEGLTPALRIFALIRLGISDSMKIAQFLRYSSSTIYNYRSKMRSNALGPRDEFENNVRRIGVQSK